MRLKSMTMFKKCMSLQNKSHTPTVFCGIDPGYDRIGIAILSGNRKSPEVVFSTCITTDKNSSLPERLLELGEKTREVLEKYSPDIVAIEDPFFFENQNTVIGVAPSRVVLIMPSFLITNPFV